MTARCRMSNTIANAGLSDHGGVTLWRRIADEFECAIAAGDYDVGDRLPSETAIADRYGVNRHTVRRALAALAGRGLVKAERGNGTFVARSRLAYPIGARTRFTDIVARAGQEASGWLLCSAEEPADGELAARLNLAPGSLLARLDILRSADRIPLCHAVSWVSADRFPGAARIYRATPSMTKMLAQFGVHDYRRQTTRVTAAICNALDAERLRLAPGRPLLLVESVDIDGSGVPVLATQARFAADRVSLVLDT